jgi:hypothetical protein
VSTSSDREAERAPSTSQAATALMSSDGERRFGCFASIEGDDEDLDISRDAKIARSLRSRFLGPEKGFAASDSRSGLHVSREFIPAPRSAQPGSGLV